MLGIQSTPWNLGYVRAAGAVDILIAGYAIADDATVLSADHDVDYLAAPSRSHARIRRALVVRTGSRLDVGPPGGLALLHRIDDDRAIAGVEQHGRLMGLAFGGAYHLYIWSGCRD